MLELPGGTLTIMPGPSNSTIKEAGSQKVISDPFNTVYDVTPQTMVNQPKTNLPPLKEDNPLKIEFISNVRKHEALFKEYEKNIKTIEQEIGPINWVYKPYTENGEPAEFNAPDLRDMILTTMEYNVLTDKNSKVIYFYTKNTGVYHKNGEQYLRFLIDKVLGEKSSVRKINETIELLKIKTCATITESKKIAVKNGLLNIETGELEEFTPLEFNTNKLNVIFNKEAKSEAWLKFIDQVCPDDKILLQEWSGYLLVKGYPFHIIMWLYGPTGRNGKGTWARTIQAILGEDNYSNVSIDEFDGKHRFAVFNLRDSLFNICSEPRTDRVLSVEMLQMITGQDDIDAERKGVQERFKFRNGAKITVMGNKFPTLDNPTEAFWERLKLCNFPNQFIGSEQIQEIEKQWLDDPIQRSGILNWILEGTKRLLTNKKFTETKTQKETILQFKRASDTISAFLMECVEFEKNSFVPKIQAYEHYKKYCEHHEIINKSNNEFSQKLKDTKKIKDTSTRILTKKTKVWGDIKLLPIGEEEPEKEPEEPNGQTKLGSGTSGTAGTSFIPEGISEEQNNKKDSGIEAVPTVPAVPDTVRELSIDYEQLSCVFCGRVIMDNDWTQDDFTWNKPAHKKCYDDKKADLKQEGL